MDAPWEGGILDLLTQYRCLPSPPGGKSLAELFLGHRTRMAHEVHRPKESETTDPPKELEQWNGKLPENAHVSTMPDPKDTYSMPNLTRIRPLYCIGYMVLVKGTPLPKGCSRY